MEWGRSSLDRAPLLFCGHGPHGRWVTESQDLTEADLEAFQRYAERLHERVAEMRQVADDLRRILEGLRLRCDERRSECKGRRPVTMDTAPRRRPGIWPPHSVDHLD